MNEPSSTLVESYPQHHPDISHFGRSSHTRSASSISSSTNRSRASSTTVRPTPPSSLPRQHEPHVMFKGAASAQRSQKDMTSASNSSHNPTPRSPRPQDVPPPSPRLQPTHPSTMSLNNSLANSPSRIKVRDLGHIQSFASEEFLTRSRQPSRQSLQGRLEGTQQYEISAMPVSDIIEMVAGLLTKITTSNDLQHKSMHRHFPSSSDGSSGLSHQATSILAFHGKNVPSITINSYLMRIHKYCPTTYEVFLSLLIYFDRMTKMVNQGTLQSFTEDRNSSPTSMVGRSGNRTTSSDSTATVRPASPSRMSTSPPNATAASPEPEAQEGDMRDARSMDLISHFVVDSFNIHRLVMAGVTCASKFFSDVFYTNSRYAKVCPHLHSSAMLPHLNASKVSLPNPHANLPLLRLAASPSLSSTT